MVQQLRLHASTAGGMDSIPGMDSNPTCGAARKKKILNIQRSKELFNPEKVLSCRVNIYQL